MKFKFNFNFRNRNKDFSLKNLSKEKIRYSKPAIIIILIALILIVFFSGISLGKTIHNSTIKNSTEVAKPILEVEKDSEIIITEDNKKGEYNFKVKNYNDLEEVSQVDLKYYIEILEKDLDKSIKYELYKENEKVELKENKTEEMKMNRGQKEEQVYTLKVEYDSNKNSIGDIIQDIQIKVHSEQLKI